MLIPMAPVPVIVHADVRWKTEITMANHAIALRRKKT